MQQSALAAELPAEPAATEKNIITIRFRLPNGQQQTRRFRRNEPIKLVINFAGSVGYLSSEYRILNSEVPKKNVGLFILKVRIIIRIIKLD